MGHRFGRRIHVGDRALDIGGDHCIADRLQGDLRPLFLQLQGVGERMALLEQLMCAQQRQGDQAEGGGQVRRQQQAHDHPRAFAKGIAEGLRRRRHPVVDIENLFFPALDVVRMGRLDADVLVHVPGDIIELIKVRITHGPAIDGFFEVAEMAEIEVKPDQAGDVIGMVATLENRQPGRLDIRRLLVQRQSQLMPALRDGNGLLVLEEFALVATVGIQIEVIDGVLLTLGPQAFTGHITANCRQYIKADAPQQGLK
ncbi:hypothetical protein D9M71_463600 [compost metagenome]